MEKTVGADGKARKQPVKKKAAKPEPEDSGNAMDPDASAEAMKAQHAEADEDEGQVVEYDARPSDSILLEICDGVVEYARAFHRSELENSERLAAAARKAADGWGLVADALADVEDDGTLDVADGTLKQLVTRAKRYARERKKTHDDIKEFRAEQQPHMDALVSRLVALDPTLARLVFNTLAIRGPCGRCEGVNFVLSLPFALTLQDALDKIASPQCSADEAAESTADDDIPDFLQEIE